MNSLVAAQEPGNASSSIGSPHDALRLELEQVRSAYQALMAAIPVEFWDSPSTNPAWNIRELAWHMIYAVRMMPADLGILLRLRSQIPWPPEWLFHPLNRWVTRWGARRLTPAQAVAQYDLAHAHLSGLLESIPEQDFERSLHYPSWDLNLSGLVSVRRLFHYPYLHFSEHTHQIDESLVRLGRVNAFADIFSQFSHLNE